MAKSRAPKIDYSDFTSKERLALVRNPRLVELDDIAIGPLFPRDEGQPIFQGMRGVPRRKTKPPLGDDYREHRRRRARLSANRNR